MRVKAKESTGVWITTHIGMLTDKRKLDLKEAGLAKSKFNALSSVPILLPETLKPLRRLKEQAETSDVSDGVKVAGMKAHYHTPNMALKSINKLDVTEVKWDAVVDQISNDWPKLCENVLDKSLEKALDLGCTKSEASKYVNQVECAQVPVERFRQQTHFNFYVEEAGEPKGNYDPVIAAKIQMSQMAYNGGLVGTMVFDATKDFRRMYENLLLKGDEKAVHGTTHLAVWEHVEKLFEYSANHPHIKSFHDQLYAVMDSLEGAHNSPLSGERKIKFMKMLSALQDQKEVYLKLQQGIPLIDLSSNKGDEKSEPEDEKLNPVISTTKKETKTEPQSTEEQSPFSFL